MNKLISGVVLMLAASACGGQAAATSAHGAAHGHLASKHDAMGCTVAPGVVGTTVTDVRCTEAHLIKVVCHRDPGPLVPMDPRPTSTGAVTEWLDRHTTSDAAVFTFGAVNVTLGCSNNSGAVWTNDQWATVGTHTPDEFASMGGAPSTQPVATSAGNRSATGTTATVPTGASACRVLSALATRVYGGKVTAATAEASITDPAQLTAFKSFVHDLATIQSAIQSGQVGLPETLNDAYFGHWCQP